METDVSNTRGMETGISNSILSTIVFFCIFVFVTIISPMEIFVFVNYNISPRRLM